MTRRTSSKAGRTETTAVNGGVIKRDSETGKFIAVHSKSGTFSSRPKSEEAAAAASEKRRAALKRLRDR